MNKTIDVLLVEDNSSDATLLKSVLSKDFNVTLRQVENERNYRQELENKKPDIILSDYTLPGFDGMQALLIRNKLSPKLPFILVTGSLNEETAVNVMKAGADDYILKENPKRLAPAIDSALKKMEIIKAKEAAEEKAFQLSRAVEQSPISIVITDLQGNIEYVNPKFTELTGYKPDEVVGKNPKILKSGHHSPEFYKALYDTILSGKDFKGEMLNKKKNGELFWENSLISTVKNDKGEVCHFIAIKEDITEKKMMLEELIKAKEKAEEINRIKSAFFSNMSHELRTPLVGILGFADILSQNLEEESDREMASSILEGGKRLLNTLTSLLSLSELESLKQNIELKPIDINSVCSDVINFYRKSINKSNIELKIEYESEKLMVDANYRLLRETLDQLLKNSVTYTESGSILIKTYKKNDSNPDREIVYIEVVDTGIGISKEKQKLIFEEFRQASEGLGRRFEGTGLGLTLSKRYLELMGAEIKVESEEGKGSTFIISFTNILEKKAQAGLVSKNETSELFIPPASISKNRIMVVEDDNQNNMFLKKCLENLYFVEIVLDAEEAIKYLRENNYDLILMDINLGKGMDGITAVQIIRKMKQHKKTPIMAMTAYASKDDEDEFLSKGCSHYIAKPFVRKELLTKINNILNNSAIDNNQGY